MEDLQKKYEAETGEKQRGHMNIEVIKTIHSSVNHVPQTAEPIATCGQAFCLCGGSLNTGFKCMQCGKQYYPAMIE